MTDDTKRLPSRSSEPLISPNDLCAVLVHEIANPLTGMFTTLQMLERRLQDRPDCLDRPVAYLLRNLGGEINRLISLLDQIRSLRVFAPLDPHPTSLAEEFAELLALQAVQYARHGIRIEQDIASDLPPVRADRGKLRQILLNLCKNGVEAMPNGGTLTLRGYRVGAEACLEIADTGEGLPQGARLFEPFATSKPGGTGLGLAIVRELVRQHNGTLSYSSRPGEGTVFFIRLPVASAG